MRVKVLPSTGQQRILDTQALTLAMLASLGQNSTRLEENFRKPLMPSFDIVSEVTWQEVRNAVLNAQREVASRWDFRQVTAQVTLNEKAETVTLSTESDFQLQQLLEIFCNQLHKRGVERSACTIPQQPIRSGKLWNFEITFKRGIDTPLAKQLVQIIRSQHPKVQTQIQDQQIRVTDKSRNLLQAIISTLRASEQEQPLQFTNFRD